MRIDVNSDLGEGFGAWPVGHDDHIIPLISSANVACGFHAGDPRVIDHTVATCAAHGVAVGAHVSYPDLVGFGRRFMDLTPTEIRTDVLYQLGALSAFCRAHGVRLSHVKPHGALYNRAAVCDETAGGIISAVTAFDHDLRIYAPPESSLARVAREANLTVIAEGFCDRRYRPDGTLTPRSLPGAVIIDPRLAADQAVRLATGVPLPDGPRLIAGTLCVHGDNPDALPILTAVLQALAAAGIDVGAPGADS